MNGKEHIWSRDKGEEWVNGKELAKQHFLLAVDELGER